MNCSKMANGENKNKKDSKKYSENDQWNDDLDVMPLNYVKPEVKKPIVEKAKFDKKKKKVWIPLLLTISLLAGSTPFILNTCEDKNGPKTKQIAVIASEENRKDSLTNDKEFKTIKTSIIEDTNFSEDTVIIKNIENEELITEELTENGPRNFHIIIGSFEQENNAESFVRNLDNQNIEIKIIQYNGLYRVSFNSYFDSDEAEIELDYIRKILNLKSWMAYMK